MKAILDGMSRTERPTQEQIAEALDTNQSAVSQYVNGVIPLNFKATLIFAKELGVRPEQIRTDLPEFQLIHEFWDVGVSQLKPAGHPPRWPFGLSKERYDALDPQQKIQIEQILDAQLLYYELQRGPGQNSGTHTS